MVRKQRTGRKLSQIHLFRDITSIVFIVCFICQVFIQFSSANIFCAGSACLTAVIGNFYIIDPKRLQTHPLSLMTVYGFQLSNSFISLIGATVELKPIIYNLFMPYQTFTVTAIAGLLIMLTHYIHTKMGYAAKASQFVSQYVIKRIGLFRCPNEWELWLLGFLGQYAILTSFTAEAMAEISYGDVGGKFMQGLYFLIGAPFLIPFRKYLFDKNASKNTTNALMLIVYFLLILIVAITRNRRATFSEVILNIVMCALIVFLTGKVKVKAMDLIKMSGGMVIVLPMFAFLSAVSTSMVINRNIRESLTPGQLIQKTFETMQDETAMQTAKARKDIITNEYNELYLSNDFLQRFSMTKFIDKNFEYTNGFDRSDPKLIKRQRQLFNDKMISVLPTPLLAAVGVKIDKSALEFSSGDSYAYYASNGQLGGYRLGSYLVDCYIIFGVFALVIMPIFWSIIFMFFDSLMMRTKDGMIVLSSYAALNLHYIFYDPVATGDGTASVMGFVFRFLTQQLLLLALFLAGTNLIVGFFIKRRSTRHRRLTT